MKRMREDRGVAAVEFAILLPVLILLMLGIFEFGRLFNEQVTVTNAAREAARVMAIADDPSAAAAAAVHAAAPSLNPGLTSGEVSLNITSCKSNPGKSVVATVTYPAQLLFPGFWKWATGSTLTLTGSGQMICGG
ncbi:pilus assembly protein [Microbacterium capsulatum]|uniref:Pilus assembly protein n=1 Tax=Microbacterium capsulatum TaxID=3041921 RepID=A0ABU0XE96_9MICO|nr:pilus assembly protein [Microbacterium sp. ASV81]MDQ4213403.1 pilus assembly protein [Microbacterium sp. ASV81]